MLGAFLIPKRNRPLTKQNRPFTVSKTNRPPWLKTKSSVAHQAKQNRPFCDLNRPLCSCRVIIRFLYV